MPFLQSEWDDSTPMICFLTCQTERRTCEKFWQVRRHFKNPHMIAIFHTYFDALYLEPFKEETIVEVFQPQSNSACYQTENRSALKKRKYSISFGESDTENSPSQNQPPLLCSSKKPSLHRALSMYSSEFLSQNSHIGPGHSRLLDSPAHPAMVLGSSSGHHSGTVFSSSHFPSGETSTQAMYEGRNILMCAQNNCCYSRAPAARTQPPYPATDSFPSMTSQEFPAHAPLPTNQPLQHYPVRGLMEASHSARQPDFYSLYGQSSAKHFINK